MQGGNGYQGTFASYPHFAGRNCQSFSAGGGGSGPDCGLEGCRNSGDSSTPGRSQVARRWADYSSAGQAPRYATVSGVHDLTEHLHEAHNYGDANGRHVGGGGGGAGGNAHANWGMGGFGKMVNWDGTERWYAAGGGAFGPSSYPTRWPALPRNPTPPPHTPTPHLHTLAPLHPRTPASLPPYVMLTVASSGRRDARRL